VRPFGVSFLAFLAVLSLVVAILAAPLGGWIALAVALGSGALAYGLWELKGWAWTLAIAFWALGFAEALWLLTQDTVNTNLILGPVVVAYLRRSDIRPLFGH
jgi:hypothetical protein